MNAYSLVDLRAWALKLADTVLFRWLRLLDLGMVEWETEKVELLLSCQVPRGKLDYRADSR